MSTPAEHRVMVDGVDLDAVTAAVRSCAAVEDLDAGPAGSAATYFPGGVVAGVSVDDRRVLVQVRAVWGFAATELAREVRAAVAPHAEGRRVDVTISDVAVPDPVAGPEDGTSGNLDRWTSSAGGSSAASSFARTIPTGEATPPHS